MSDNLVYTGIKTFVSTLSVGLLGIGAHVVMQKRKRRQEEYEAMLDDYLDCHHTDPIQDEKIMMKYLEPLCKKDSFKVSEFNWCDGSGYCGGTFTCKVNKDGDHYKATITNVETGEQYTRRIVGVRAKSIYFDYVHSEPVYDETGHIYYGCRNRRQGVYCL